jgi:hypothetical protein
MKYHSHALSGLAASAFLLIAAFTLAQATPGSKPEHPRDASVVQPVADQNQPAPAHSNSKSMGSAHATESLTTTNPKGNAKPQDTAGHRSGENPLYESKDKTAAKPKSKTPTVEYKDPEDMTTRYRPGNNKTTKTENKPPSSTTPPPQ